ncbi:plasmalemma vesicle associated protein a isoform X2 [Dunckerocampus dactyliophorus]|uniref:plasmalemma vesicle associated protein a isoform X2 n=1 Tax=Dunckerocampus dactyliophorus TaxID=161453 RepID=UPI00240575EC|nr:plasmalemma vesicle associated protein a isoform X2 [Dunckerocampus dactyliophorus]
MYSSGYSQVSKYSPQAQKKMQYQSKGKSCSYYLRIIFFFSSLIQSLIIVSLVLFLVYGKTQDSASAVRIQDLEESFSRLSIENVALRQQRRNLTNLLNITLVEKTRNEWDMLKIRYIANISSILIQDLDKRLQQTNLELMICRNQPRFPQTCSQPLRSVGCNCGLQMEHLTARLELVESNFTQTTQRMRVDMDQIAKERDNLELEAIRLRRDKSVHQNEIEFSKQRCKEDFVQSLSGISNVSRAFLLKIESLFPTYIALQLTCLKQREHLEQIRSNCTSLSREVVDRFQNYLNTVGDQVSEIQTENSHLKAENLRLFDDYRSCSQNRTGLIQQHRQNLEKLQLKHDKDYERLLLEKRRLNGDIEVLENNVNYKNKEFQHVKEQLRQLNMSCMAKTGLGGFPGGSSNFGQFGRVGSDGFGSSFNSPGLGLSKPGIGSSTGSGFNRLGSTGLGSPSLGSTGSGLNRLGSSGLGSPSLGSTGSGLNRQGSPSLGSSSSGSTGSGLNKQGSTGLGSSGLGLNGSGLNKLGSTGLGSSTVGSTGLGLNKQASTGLGSFSLGSTGSGLNKQGSTGLGSSALGSTGSGLNKQGSTGLGSSSVGSTGSGLNKQGSTGLGSSSVGSTGSGLNKQGSTGLGSSSVGSTGSGLSKLGLTGLGSFGLGSTGSGLNKQGSTGLGSPGLGSTGSGLTTLGSSGLGSTSLGSTGLGLNKPASTGLGSSSLGSTGSGFNKVGSSGLGTSSLGSAASNPSLSSSGASANKPTSSMKTSPGLGSAGSTSKSGSSNSGFPWFGFGSSNSNTGQSKPGSGIGRGTSNGSSLGTGRTSSLGGGSVSIAQHLQDLQRIINPSYSSDERQDLSRMLG